MVEEKKKKKKYYKKKIERCQKLGAEKFKKAVFALEKLKFKIIKTEFFKISYNYIKITIKIQFSFLYFSET